MIRIVVHFSIRLFWNGRTLGRKHTGQHTGQPLLADVAGRTIAALTAARGKSTIDNYRTALRSLLCYAGSSLTVDRLDQTLIEGWQHWLTGRGVTLNTISCYMRSMRAVICHSEVGPACKSAFKSVFTGNTTTDKRSLPAADIQKLLLLPLDDHRELQLSRDIFLFSLYALGMPFVDVAFLRKSQIADGYITYHRHKTGQRIRVKVEPPMQRIINRYARSGSPFAFPLLRQGTMAEYEAWRSRYNRQLRQLGRLAKLDKRLTSYVARHSWASMAYHSNVDLPVISKALGHTSSKTTQVYIREIDDCRIDTANRRLLRSFQATSC